MKLSGLKHSRRFIDWRGASSFAHELEMLLQDLKSGVDDPLTGVKLVAAFYGPTISFLRCVMTPAENIGDVFRYNAKALFVDYASRCKDKEKIADIIRKTNQKDNYGIRDTLIDCAGECLPEKVIRAMIATLQKWETQVIQEFTIKGYTMDDERLKNDGDVSWRNTNGNFHSCC